MKQAIFQVRIQVEDDQELNPLYLSEELQASINSMYSYRDSETGEITDLINNSNITQYNNKIVGYKLDYDNFVPFIAEEEY